MLVNTGEYCIPELVDVNAVNEHIERYRFASKFIRNKIVLDIACGVGYGSEILVRAGAKKVVGVDINKNVINHARTNYKHPKLFYLTGDATTYQSSSKFDVIVSFETIEHIINDHKI